jgi:hypothetical protein
MEQVAKKAKVGQEPEPEEAFQVLTLAPTQRFLRLKIACADLEQCSRFNIKVSERVSE